MLTLRGQKAIELWLSGKDSWNEWVDKNKVDNVDFQDVDFGKLRAEHNLEVFSFVYYRFPKGDVDFTGAKFGGGVCFNQAEFGKGRVNFYGAEFGKGRVYFMSMMNGCYQEIRPREITSQVPLATQYRRPSTKL